MRKYSKWIIWILLGVIAYMKRDWIMEKVSSMTKPKDLEEDLTINMPSQEDDSEGDLA